MLNEMIKVYSARDKNIRFPFLAVSDENAKDFCKRNGLIRIKELSDHVYLSESLLVEIAELGKDYLSPGERYDVKNLGVYKITRRNSGNNTREIEMAVAEDAGEGLKAILTRFDTTATPKHTRWHMSYKVDLVSPVVIFTSEASYQLQRSVDVMSNISILIEKVPVLLHPER